MRKKNHRPSPIRLVPLTTKLPADLKNRLIADAESKYTSVSEIMRGVVAAYSEVDIETARRLPGIRASKVEV